MRIHPSRVFYLGGPSQPDRGQQPRRRGFTIEAKLLAWTRGSGNASSHPHEHYRQVYVVVNFGLWDMKSFAFDGYASALAELLPRLRSRLRYDLKRTIWPELENCANLHGTCIAPAYPMHSSLHCHCIAPA